MLVSAKSYYLSDLLFSDCFGEFAIFGYPLRKLNSFLAEICVKVFFGGEIIVQKARRAAIGH